MHWTAVFLLATAWAAEYEVGPGKSFERIGQAPWASLEPGDTVLIHWRAEPYREKWVVCRQGAEDAPITIRGVPNEDGLLPVIDAGGAVTAQPLNYSNEERSLIKIGGANVPADLMPKHIVIENLDLRGARPGNFFTDDSGAQREYVRNAASIHIEKGEHFTIRNCVLSDSGNGLFTGSLAATPTRNVLVEANHVFGNGIVGSGFEHNSYTEALGITFQFNRYGPLRPGANGNNLKDRSAGLVVRYNWIEGGNRQLDLVETNSPVILEHESYRNTFVYGNVLIEPAGAGNPSARPLWQRQWRRIKVSQRDSIFFP